ncbi:MAG: hypothetical protein CGU28_02320 [Candidatus Dactylopiibacterium carminicum]|uniref:Threonine transporter RhtB n=1 Tax=Candidatus Dactylopiibacterium carminicum TaxID=857335 RepID=A0A272EVA6_9RHOO|nr:LysE family transporter [Candidatus Dactylopiibacterium carminicum]KAF7600121.1 hypothetical protein BGI27_04300 [Candidatus Dactylopiibacterium carminicum]PAS94049.1 MAG: hypothetical protein CGU29_05255 [Candidatus Dactylopiibacterium carminicum]PAS98187.1 MAG: hypothetical protein CGU28_02320 [Candidatus Dactylopiibacterium carminicum]PAT00119.1 MAG: hypothetical protein BSR46_04325 [Candidatus Dactylopiibacterium carminicum]
MSFNTWLAFFVAAWVISLSPGPGALSCMAAGQRFGFRRALWNLLGLQLGLVFLIALVATGLGALLATSQHLFEFVKWAGVGYLLWLGVQQWRAPARPLVASEAGPGDARALALRAFLINTSNPKGIVFMLAVLPQFVDPGAPQALQYMICGATLVFTDVVVMCGYTLLAARVLRSLSDPRHLRWLNRAFGSLFVGAGMLQRVSGVELHGAMPGMDCLCRPAVRLFGSAIRARDTKRGFRAAHRQAGRGCYAQAARIGGRRTAFAAACRDDAARFHACPCSGPCPCRCEGWPHRGPLQLQLP